MSGTMNTAYSTANGTTTAASACSCPVCQGLQTFSSPLYASGALLTADDLSSEQAFVRAKMRLHNRHLHGWGTVCGLEVVCDDCDGWVRIKPGYAIDPCGNDIVLAGATPFNLVKAIQACTTARPKIGDCNPYTPPPDPGCQDVDTHWCVTLRYNELQTAQTAQFLRQAVAPGGCTCGGKSGCGCGQSTAGIPAATAGSLSYVTPNCTARRLLECVEIGIEPHSGPCAPVISTNDRETGIFAKAATGVMANLATLAPPGSLLRRIIQCVEQVIAVLNKRMTAADAAALEALGTGTIGQGVTAQSMHDALCRLRQALLDFMISHDPVRCQMLAASAGIMVPAVENVPGGQQSAAQYGQNASSVTRDLMLAWVQAGADCVCEALLPPCPADPGDMRVPIACVTVRGSKIVDICNFACRHYAGSFPSLYYWLSLVPIVPVLSQLVAAVCCAPDAISPKQTSGLATVVEAFDPTGTWRKALMQNKFAAPASFVRTIGSLDLKTVLSTIKLPAAPVSAAAAIGQPAEAAVGALAQQGVTAQVETVSDTEALSFKLATLSSGVVESGAQVRLMVNNGTVVGLAPATVATATDTASLKLQIDALTTRIAHLETGGKP